MYGLGDLSPQESVNMEAFAYLYPATVPAVVDSTLKQRPYSYPSIPTMKKPIVDEIMVDRENSLPKMKNSMLDEIRLDFNLNGFDVPYETQKESNLWRKPGSGQFSRQWSWPQPEASPRAPLPRASEALDLLRADLNYSVPQPASIDGSAPLPGPPSPDPFTPEQLQLIMNIAPSELAQMLQYLRNQLPNRRPQTPSCAFCKKNGEREPYYSSHRLKDAAGRVVCPVLSAFVCSRCGATGDRAHTYKYCPWTTERDMSRSPGAPAPAPAFPRRALAPPGGELPPAWLALEEQLSPRPPRSRH